ncbi:hypothetical protein ACFQ9X_28250 [Catenulispora yoronensis]
MVATLGAMAGLVVDKTMHASAVAAKKSVRGAVVTVTGPPVPIAHGVVQVRITVAAGHIDRVVAVRLPHDNAVSWARSVVAARRLAGRWSGRSPLTSMA